MIYIIILSFFLKNFAYGNGYFSVVARKNIINEFLLGLLCNQADNRNDNKRSEHCKCTAVNGALNDCREVRAKEHVGNHNTRTPDKADCTGGFCDLFPIQAVKERCKERAGKSTPRKTHELSNESYLVFVLNYGNNCGNYNENKNKSTNYNKRLFLIFLL